ncbi:asparaginase [Cohnella sp. REN36]|uniref:asparaginase n=1 Tax=Cohnella sp. REN36 TaxID=2887347 RepID=UPI001D157868|nr:asparaginase domain-containing protein [Cohnella sp. REN36]MCC3377443.1 asparaginase domain-containing protein [Cohnella sp. REN36]
MNKILVVFTGGTIGSRKGDRGIDVDAAGSYFLIEQYAGSAGKREVAFEAIQPYNLLSENLIPEDWAQLTAEIRAASPESYAGVIVTHGSDTLAYSSAMLSYLLCDTRVPVVITASNYPLDDARSNGLRNFAASVDFLLDRPLPGIFTLFGNDRGESVVFLGTRITQALPFTDQFDCTYDAPFGWMKDGRFVWNEHPLNPSPDTLLARVPAPAPWAAGDEMPQVLYIKPYPGIDYRVFDFSSRAPRAVLHDLYHSGTACTREAEGRSLARFIADSRAHGVDVFLVPTRDPGGDVYASSSSLTQAGGIPIEGMSADAALMKLMLACANFADTADIVRFMRTSLFYEDHRT